MKIFKLTFHHKIFKSNIHLWCNFAKMSKHKCYNCYHCVSLYNGALVYNMEIFKLNNICCCNLPYVLWPTSKIKWTMRKLETALPQVENLTIKLFFQCLLLKVINVHIYFSTPLLFLNVAKIATKIRLLLNFRVPTTIHCLAPGQLTLPGLCCHKTDLKKYS